MPKSPFQKLDESVEQSRFLDFDRSMQITRQIFNHIKSNALGRPTGAWMNRKPGQEAIYAEPKNEMLESQVSGYWKAPLMKMMKYLGEEGGITLKEVAKKANLSDYEIDTLMQLIKHNKPSLVERVIE